MFWARGSSKRWARRDVWRTTQWGVGRAGQKGAPGSAGKAEELRLCVSRTVGSPWMALKGSGGIRFVVPKDLTAG